jgi:glycosyltransferase involved in cell wall biosynthesis
VRKATAPALTIVVPTRNESENVAPLIGRLHTVLDDVDTEIIFVDDSDDNTAAAIRAVAADSQKCVRVLHRPPGTRSGGLGGAVSAGFAAARGGWVVVMDGDLQHPPEVIPLLIAVGDTAGADAVVASRYCGEGSGAGLDGGVRRLVSTWSGNIARIVFPRHLRAVTDPMSGFFAVRRECIPLDQLRPDGYKILLEVLIRSAVHQVVEVAYTFQPRLAGESKASLREGVRFIRHLTLLRLQTLARPRSRIGQVAWFMAAGGSGIVVHSAVLWLLAGLLSVPYLIGALLATQAAIGWNFLIIDNLAMPCTDDSAGRRLTRFWLLNNLLVPLHLALLAGLVQTLGIHFMWANLLAIAVVFTLRYLVTSSWIYGSRHPVAVSRLARAVVDSIRSAPGRVVVVMALTAIAFPGAVAIAWNQLWVPGPETPLIIPLVAAAALTTGRLQPSADEPHVHDRQVDGLLAMVLGVLAAALTTMAADANSAPSSWILPAMVAYLAAATTLLLGTRTAARLRGALVLPLVALPLATPAFLDEIVGSAVHGGAQALSAGLTGGLSPVLSGALDTGHMLSLPDEAVPSAALAGTLLCLVVCGLCCFGPSLRGLLHVVVGAFACGVVAITGLVIAAIVGGLFGMSAFHVAVVPAIPALTLALIVALLGWRWSRTVALPTAERQYLPRGRFAVAALFISALALGAPRLPDPFVYARHASAESTLQLAVPAKGHQP